MGVDNALWIIDHRRVLRVHEEPHHLRNHIREIVGKRGEKLRLNRGFRKSLGRIIFVCIFYAILLIGSMRDIMVSLFMLMHEFSQ